MARRSVHYFFAFRSPFAALADTRIDDLVAGAGAELLPVPVVPPAQPPPEGLAAMLVDFRRSYIAEDAARWARRLGLDWKWQAPAPGAALADDTDAAAGWYFAREAGRERAYRNGVFLARFEAGRDITRHDVLADCAAEAGLDRAAFLDALRSRRFHDEVPKAIALCVENRVFGVPFFVVDGQHFWGNDRIDFLLEALRA
jgi:2-hydroxychromene-2-carboxylate isomerase